MLLALHFASLLVVSGSFQLLYLFYVAVHNCLSVFLCLALTIETLMSFRYLFCFFNFVFDFFDFLSGIAIDGECSSAGRFHMYCRFCCLFFFLLCIRRCLCCGSVVESCVGSCRCFFVVLQLRPVHVDCRVALIHWLVLTTLLHVILIQDFSELVRCHNLAILFNVVTGLQSEELHLLVFLVILVFCSE